MPEAAATLRARRDTFVRPLGTPPTRTLGTGAAVFPGGIRVISPDGASQILRAAPSVWIWPAILGGVGAVIVAVLAVAVGGPAWLRFAVVASFGLVFGVMALGALVFARQRARYALVVDARRRTLDEIRGGRVVLSIPADVIQAVRLQRYENSDDEVRYNVLVHAGPAELWVHQEGSEQDGAALGRSIAGALGVPFDPQVERVG